MTMELEQTLQKRLDESNVQKEKQLVSFQEEDIFDVEINEWFCHK